MEGNVERIMVSHDFEKLGQQEFALKQREACESF
jgi:hypothetical protein